jgi:hypothetical protein
MGTEILSKSLDTALIVSVSSVLLGSFCGIMLVLVYRWLNQFSVRCKSAVHIFRAFRRGFSRSHFS